MTREQLVNDALLDISLTINKHIGTLSDYLKRNYSNMDPKHILLSEIDNDMLMMLEKVSKVMIERVRIGHFKTPDDICNYCGLTRHCSPCGSCYIDSEV